MLQTLRNRRNRKGFTLAELLIVVAIIAVLVAIAVPLFVGALNDAEDRVMDANKRAVRGAAVGAILSNYNSYKLTPTTEKGWIATADIKDNGDMVNLEITKATEDISTKPDECVAQTGEGATCKYKVTVYLVEDELPDAPTTSGTGTGGDEDSEP